MRSKALILGIILAVLPLPVMANWWWPFAPAEQTSKAGSATPRTSLVGQFPPADGFTLLAGGAGQYRPADWVGKPVFVNFFASWCAPCRAEHPYLLELKQRTGMMMVGIAHLDRAQAASTMLAQLGNPFTLTLADATGRGGKNWGLNGVPESFILDAKGRIVWNHRGPLNTQLLKDEIYSQLQSLGVSIKP
jgi:cytochrome c biogenesis protein CcmG, thiol:disulfide interchange protein DsbE